MSKVIILEGPDGGGKTTLANTLRDQYGYEYLHTGKPKPGQDVFKAYTRTLWRAINMKRRIVLDRCYLGERVYGPVMRGKDLLGEEATYLLNRLVAANDVLQVICLPRFATCLANWKLKTNDYVKEVAQLEAIYDGYLELTNFYYGRLYDYAEHKVEDLFTPKRTLPYGMLGHASARFLVVGEQVNVNVASHDLPFYAMNGSSHFLNRALWEVGYKEPELAFINAFDLRGKERDLVSFLKYVPQVRVVIALGGKALRVCQHSGFQDLTHDEPDITKYVALPHPAYWKRFRQTDRHMYLDLLRKVREEFA